MFRRWLQFLLFALATGLVAEAKGPSPFKVSPSLVTTETGWDLAVSFDFPPGHYLYADRLAFSIEGMPGSPNFQLPPPAPPTGSERQPQFRQQFVALNCQTGRPPSSVVLAVFLHGCDADNCYFPEVRRFRLSPGTAAVELPPDLATPGPPEPPRWRLVADGFSVRTRTSFTDEADFRHFLQEAGVTSAPAKQAAIPWWLIGGLAVATFGWTTLRSRHGRRRPLVLILTALVGLGALAQHRSSGIPGAPTPTVALDFAANSAAEDELANLLSRALNEGSPVLLSLQPATVDPARTKPGEILATRSVSGVFKNVRLQLPATTDPRSRELCQYFAVERPPVFALLVPRNHPGAGLALNLQPGNRRPGPR